MIKAYMTESEIIAEATARHNREPFYTTLEGEIAFVREMSQEDTKLDQESVAYIEEYYQMFVDGIDGVKWEAWETQNFYYRVVRESIRKEANKKHFALPRDEYFEAKNKLLAVEAEAREIAARKAFVKYAAETGFVIKAVNPFAGIAWEPDMITDLTNYTE